MIPKVSFIVNWLVLLRGSFQGLGEEAKCWGETEISTELLRAGRLLVGDSAVFF